MNSDTSKHTNKISVRFLSHIFILPIICIIFLIGCNNINTQIPNEKIEVITTTTMLADLVKNIGGDTVSVQSLMGAGVDPHLYQASASDVTKIYNSNVVVYNGFHLEGKMSDIFASLNNQNKTVISLEDGLSKTKLLPSKDDENLFDPHIWFDVLLWKDAAVYISQRLSEVYPENTDIYSENLELYLNELDALDDYIKSKIASLLKEQRVLITAHDAFQYFGNRYEFTVMGLQGISTEAKSGTADIINLAQFIVDNKIKAIFIENSVPHKNIEALQASALAKGFQVEIGGQLYSDSLGDTQSNTDTYILTFKYNIDTIVNALK